MENSRWRKQDIDNWNIFFLFLFITLRFSFSFSLSLFFFLFFFPSYFLSLFFTSLLPSFPPLLPFYFLLPTSLLSSSSSSFSLAWYWIIMQTHETNFLVPVLNCLDQQIELVLIFKKLSLSHFSVSVQFSHSVVSDSLWPHELQPTRPPCPSPTPGVHPNPYPSSWWCHPAILSYRPLLLLPWIFPGIRVFSNESALRIRWPKYWSFSFSISPSNEHSGLISFRMDWLDLLAVQGTLKSRLQHHSSKASILLRSAFLIVQLIHPYMTTGKTIALTRWTFDDKVMSLLFNMLSRLGITFLPRSKCLLISWLHSPSAVILEPRKIKSATVSTVSTSISHEVMGPDAMILVFWAGP